MRKKYFYDILNAYMTNQAKIKRGVIMRFIWTIIWAVLFSGTISYVLASMAGESFNLTATLIMAGIFSLAVWVLGEGLLKEEKQN